MQQVLKKCAMNERREDVGAGGEERVIALLLRLGGKKEQQSSPGQEPISTGSVHPPSAGWAGGRGGAKLRPPLQVSSCPAQLSGRAELRRDWVEGREARLSRGQLASDLALAVDTFHRAAHRPSVLIALRNHLGSCKNNSSWAPAPRSAFTGLGWVPGSRIYYESHRWLQCVACIENLYKPNLPYTPAPTTGDKQSLYESKGFGVVTAKGQRCDGNSDLTSELQLPHPAHKSPSTGTP